MSSIGDSLDLAASDLTGASYDSIDVATVDPNPSVDQSVSGGDGGASAVSDIANAVGKWGTVIGSIVSNTPIVAAQTKTGQIVPVGSRGSTVYGARPMGSNLVLVLVVVVGGVILFSMAKK